MLVKSKEGIQVSDSLAQLKRQGAFTLAELVHISFQQIQGLQSFGACCSQKLMLGYVFQSSVNLLKQI